MTELEKAARQALEDLVDAARMLGATLAKQSFGIFTPEDGRFVEAMYEAVAKHKATLRQALEREPDDEPYCYVYTEGGEEYFAPKGAYVPDNAQALYTRPQKSAWVGLTYQERTELWDETVKYSPSEVRIHDFAKDIEAKLKEKNT